MFSSFKIGKIAGIEIGVHWSWLFIFALITWSFASGILKEYFEDWSTAQRWSVGVIVAIIFFTSILLHELSHSLVAKARGIPVQGITLFVFGGVSNLGREAQSAGEEFWIAIVGPLTSIAIGVLFAGLGAVLWVPARDAASISLYLAMVNGIIAVFNLLPGFPLDGGRVFRSIVWARNRNLLRATRISARVGEYVAYLLMAAGALQILFGLFVGGVWMIFIAIFLRNASSGSYEQLLLEMALKGVSAGELARRDYDLVSPEMTVAQLVDEHMLAGHGRAYPVMAGENLLGLITLTDVRRLAREEWPETTVFRAMTPFERLRTVAPQESAARVLQMMSESDLNQVPVVDGRCLAGIVSRGDILRLIQMRQAVGLSDSQTLESQESSQDSPRS
jgi:Zn-dependent protease/CBS domain-containing protein